MAPLSPTKPKGGLSLYADLVDPSTKNETSSAATITAAPVSFKRPSGDAELTGDASKTQISAAALRFQPTKRPQVAAQKTSQKIAQAKAAALTAALAQKSSTASHASAAAATAETSSSSAKPSNGSDANPPAGLKSTLADWTGDPDEDAYAYQNDRRQRGGRKKRKKNNHEGEVVQQWDDVYDPARPNNYEAYRHSDERMQELRDWKDCLYAHRMARRTDESSESEDDAARRPFNNQFAPPPMVQDLSSSAATESAKHPNPASSDAADGTGDDAYARRMRMSQQSHPPPPPDEPPPVHSMQPPAPVLSTQPPPVTTSSSHTISHAPVRYNLPPAPAEIPKTEEELAAALEAEATAEADESGTAEETNDDAPRSLRPGQRGFAARLMSKYGWSKGEGLGAQSSGIINPLRVQVEKAKRRSDADGGGVVSGGNRGKILGGKRKDGQGITGKFGEMSAVVILHGMVDGLDLDYEMSEGGLLQDIGEECGEKYGRVERVYIHRAESAAAVFVKFTDQLSALRAVNALEGRIFNGNTIVAKFFDSDKFDQGIFT